MTKVKSPARLITAGIVVCALAASVALAGCGSGEVKDGTYTGQSSVMEGDEEAIEDSGYGVAVVTISGGKITACEFTTYEPDGTLKDENYGTSLSGNEAKYRMAQTAVQACDQYAAQLVETGDISKVDVISGATVNYNEFVDAVDDALAQARS